MSSFQSFVLLALLSGSLDLQLRVIRCHTRRTCVYSRTHAASANVFVKNTPAGFPVLLQLFVVPFFLVRRPPPIPEA